MISHFHFSFHHFFPWLLLYIWFVDDLRYRQNTTSHGTGNIITSKLPHIDKAWARLTYIAFLRDNNYAAIHTAFGRHTPSFQDTRAKRLMTAMIHLPMIIISSDATASARSARDCWGYYSAGQLGNTRNMTMSRQLPAFSTTTTISCSHALPAQCFARRCRSAFFSIGRPR